PRMLEGENRRRHKAACFSPAFSACGAVWAVVANPRTRPTLAKTKPRLARTLRRFRLPIFRKPSDKRDHHDTQSVPAFLRPSRTASHHPGSATHGQGYEGAGPLISIV